MHELKRRYIHDCKIYGWTPSNRGLAVYYSQVMNGLRTKWRKRRTSGTRLGEFWTIAYKGNTLRLPVGEWRMLSDLVNRRRNCGG